MSKTANKNPFKITIILLLQGFVLSSSAQQRVTLQQCIDYGNNKNFAIRIQELRSQQAENSLTQSRKAIFPTVSGIFSQGLNSGRSIDPFSNDFIQSTNSSNNFGLSGNLSLFNGFALKNQIKQNQSNAEAEEFEVLRLKKELKSKITLAFMQVLMTQELSKTAQEQVKSLQNQYFRVRELVNEGNIPRTDLIDLDAQLATAEFDALNAKTNIENTKLALAQLMSFPNTHFELQELKLEEQLLLLNDAYLNHILESLTSQPILKTTALRLESSKLGIKVVQAERFPSVSFGLGLGSAYSSAAKKQLDYFKQLDFNFNQYANIRVNIPIYGAGQIDGKIKQAEINQQIADIGFSQTKLALKQEIEQAFLLTKTAQEKLNSAKRQLTAQEIAYLSAKDRYLEGLLHSIELNNFRINLEKAKSNAIQSKYEFHFRKMVLDFYVK